MFRHVSIFFLLVLTTALTAQPSKKYTRIDSLRGSITPERVWWDLSFYDLAVKVNIPDSSISGSNKIRYRVIHEKNLMQIDMQVPMEITGMTQDNQALGFVRDGNSYFVTLSAKQTPGSFKEILVTFKGKPRVSVSPPWSGGVVWSKDKNNTDFIATACQGDGASLWWPCKDHEYDEPDSMRIAINVPRHLTAVSNGRLRRVETLSDYTKTFHWAVVNPINNYGVNMNIGDYTHFSNIYVGEKGELDCDFYVLSYNLNNARLQFSEVPRMLRAFEHWLGPYPFYEDGYKLVEVPYVGMEHQSSVTYGNGYKNGYKQADGSHIDLSRTGWGMKFDFIIVHESGHEWFANSITDLDIADMWIHEGFTTYAENLFLEYYFGKEAGAEYVIGTRANILNDRPLIGVYNVNQQGSSDMYYKGANMLHTLRQIVNNDEKWRQILRKMNEEFYHRVVTTIEVEMFLSRETGRMLNKFFDQYLRTTQIPSFQYSIDNGTLKYRWINCVEGFNMPVRIFIDAKEVWLEPETWEKEIPLAPGAVMGIDKNFLIKYEKVAH